MKKGWDMKKKLLRLLLALSTLACSCIVAYPMHTTLTDEDPPFFSDERYIETADQEVEIIPVNNAHLELHEME